MYIGVDTLGLQQMKFCDFLWLDTSPGASVDIFVDIMDY